MKLGSAGIVVLGMSASFILILVVMVVALRPGPAPSPSRRSTAPSSPERSNPAPERNRSTPARAEVGRTQQDDTPVSESSTRADSVREARTAERVAQLPEPEQTTYWKLQQERKEVLMLQKAMKERLAEKERARKQKIDRLAATCDQLKPNEAAPILLSLDNDTLRDVLKKMDADKAARVAALLDGLGRSEALTYIKGS